MKLLGHRFSYVGSHLEALAMGKTLMALGLEPKQLFSAQMLEAKEINDDDFSGAIFASDSRNWIEVWAELPGLPKGYMLQLIVDDVDAFAEHAKKNGLDPQGPVEAHGEKIYYLMTPTGLPISFQSQMEVE